MHLSSHVQSRLRYHVANMPQMTALVINAVPLEQRLAHSGWSLDEYPATVRLALFQGKSRTFLRERGSLTFFQSPRISSNI